MLECCGDVLAPKTDHILPHVPPEDLVEGGRLLGLVVHRLRQLPGDEVGLLERLYQVSREEVSKVTKSWHLHLRNS